MNGFPVYIIYLMEQQEIVPVSAKKFQNMYQNLLEIIWITGLWQKSCLINRYESGSVIRDRIDDPRDVGLMTTVYLVEGSMIAKALEVEDVPEFD